jgi:hypothetical protein
MTIVELSPVPCLIAALWVLDSSIVCVCKREINKLKGVEQLRNDGLDVKTV